MPHLKPVTAMVCGLLWTLTSGARAQFFVDRYSANAEGFETDCTGADIETVLTFDDGTVLDFDEFADLPATFFSACGIASITSFESGEGSAQGPAQIHRPDDPAAVAGMTGSFVLTGGFVPSNDQSWNLEITFVSPVHQLALDVLSVDNPGGLTIEIVTTGGSAEIRTPSATGSAVYFGETFPEGVREIRLLYDDGDEGTFVNPDGWFLDQLRFNTWHCGDGENESPEACDDGDVVECDGCRSDCTLDIAGCLVDGTCVAHGAIDPESDGCARCDQPLADPEVEVVAYTGFESEGTDCTALGDDGLDCTENVCDGAGRCVHPVHDGRCAIGGTCLLAGVHNPDNPCQTCNAEAEPHAWSPRPMGTVCDDGDACTDDTPEDDDPDNGDVCNDQGQCVGGAALDCDDGLACTVDTCGRDTGCVSTLASGCLIQAPSGEDVCRGSGEQSPDDPCQACVPSKDTHAWSPRDVGERCGDPACEAGVLTKAPSCDADGACVEGEEQPCEGAVCADAVSCTGACARDDDCLRENYCEDRECIPDWPVGERCESDSQCKSGFCTDGVCCDKRCERACEACNLEDDVGVCTPHAAGSDPDGDCPTEPEVQLCSGASECVDADLPNGIECSVDGECESGQCVDGVCCDTPCEGVCTACNLENKAGTCSPHPIQTDPEDECDQACNGAGECVSFEVRGNGFCSTRPGGPPAGSWSLALAAAALALISRRRSRKAPCLRNRG